MFGVDGLNTLVPWFWTSLIAIIVAFAIMVVPDARRNYRVLPVACALAFFGIWVQKGFGLLVPGYIPSPIGEFTNYQPTILEVLVTLGNWAIGFFILTILVKGAIGVLLGEIKYTRAPWESIADAAPYYRPRVEPPGMQPWAPLTAREAQPKPRRARLMAGKPS